MKKYKFYLTFEVITEDEEEYNAEVVLKTDDKELPSSDVEDARFAAEEQVEMDAETEVKGSSLKNIYRALNNDFEFDDE